MVHQIVVRLDAKIDQLLREIARARGQDVSNFVRAVIKTELARLSYLTPEEKKALGVLSETTPTPTELRCDTVE